jgi:hypothetical protein
MCDRAAFLRFNRVGRSCLRQALFDAAPEVCQAELHHILDASGFNQRIVEGAALADVREQFLHRRHAFRFTPGARERSRHSFKEVVDVAEEEIVRVPKVGVEGGAAHSGAVENLLDADLLERLLL